jgi:hypothetical protein
MSIRELTWEEQVNNLAKLFNFKSNFNLSNHFKELPTITQKRDAFVKELDRRESDNRIIKSCLKKEEQILKAMENISKATQVELGLSELITSKRDLIKIFSNHVNQSCTLNLGKKYHYSKPFLYIARLVGIFHEGTGLLPVCNKGDNYEEYNGGFYNFLIESKPLLKSIGVDLMKDETMGKYAFQQLNGYVKRGIQHSSYLETLNYFNSEEFTQL